MRTHPPRIRQPVPTLVAMPDLPDPGEVFEAFEIARACGDGVQLEEVAKRLHDAGQPQSVAHVKRILERARRLGYVLKVRRVQDGRSLTLWKAVKEAQN